jgi:hypothetical protein
MPATSEAAPRTHANVEVFIGDFPVLFPRTPKIGAAEYSGTLWFKNLKDAREGRVSILIMAICIFPSVTGYATTN